MPCYNWRNEVRSEFQPPSDENFTRVERKLGKKIPEDLRAFIAEHNQAYFGLPRFRRAIRPGEDETMAIYILRSIAGVPTNDEEAEATSLVWVSHIYDVDQNVPSRFLGFASTLQHCALCISTAAPDEGAIYLWDPVLIDQLPNVPSMKHMHFLAPNLDAFLNSLEGAPTDG
jgi:hypothetical protein